MLFIKQITFTHVKMEIFMVYEVEINEELLERKVAAPV
jgi:hypothetical protein